jgi:hypothetical protein
MKIMPLRLATWIFFNAGKPYAGSMAEQTDFYRTMSNKII